MAEFTTGDFKSTDCLMFPLRQIGLAGLLCFALGVDVLANDPHPKLVELPLEALAIGQDLQPGVPFVVTVKGSWPMDYSFSKLNYKSLFGALEVLTVEDKSTVEDEQVLYQVDISVKAEKPGLFVVAPVVIDLKDKKKVVARAISRRLFLEIPKGAAANADLRQNKGLQSISRDLKLLYGLLAFLLIAVGAAVLYWWMQKRKSAPPIDPYAQWLAGFSKLRNHHDPDDLMSKSAAYDLTHLVRQYIEYRSTITALEMTGKELLLALKSVRDSGEIGENWRVLAEFCVELESIKYRENARSDRSFSDWSAEISRSVDTAESTFNVQEIVVEDA